MTVDLLPAPAGDGVFVDEHGIRHEMVAHFTIGWHRCSADWERWPCRPVMLEQLGRDHPDAVWCPTCGTAGPCTVRQDLLDLAVTP
jgi:hypothetical protein